MVLWTSGTSISVKGFKRYIGMLRRVKSYGSTETLKYLYQALVQPHAQEVCQALAQEIKLENTLLERDK